MQHHDVSGFDAVISMYLRDEFGGASGLSSDLFTGSLKRLRRLDCTLMSFLNADEGAA